jgi:hypothetical protein
VCNKEFTPEAASLMSETNGIWPVHTVQNSLNTSIVAIPILILSPGTEHTHLHAVLTAACRTRSGVQRNPHQSEIDTVKQRYARMAPWDRWTAGPEHTVPSSINVFPGGGRPVPRARRLPRRLDRSTRP